jgi:hypothetical protein
MSAAAGYVLVGDAPRAVPLAREALTLARQIGAPAIKAGSTTFGLPGSHSS